MRTVEIKFPDGHIEKMLLHEIKTSADIIAALRFRNRPNLPSDCQLDIEDYFNEGWMYFEDAITGNHIVTVFW